LRVADRLVVLDAGKVLAEGAPNDVMARADVRQAYTGVV
jgi:ABC-type branched-subunit amino acid transport system ATPase component